MSQIEQQWSAVKTAYNRILERAFDTAEKRDTAHTVILKMMASSADLLISNDKDLLHAMDVITASSNRDQHRQREQPPRTAERQSQPARSHMDIPGMPDMSNLVNMFSGPTTSLNGEEMRQLFSFWPIFSENGTERDGNSEVTRNAEDPSRQPDPRTRRPVSESTRTQTQTQGTSNEMESVD